MITSLLVIFIHKMSYGYSFACLLMLSMDRRVTAIRLFSASLLMLSMDKMSYGHSLQVCWCYPLTKWLTAIHCQSVDAIHGQNELRLFIASLLMLSMDKMAYGYSLPICWCYPCTIWVMAIHCQSVDAIHGQNELRLFIASLLMLSSVCLIDYGLFLFFQGWSSSASFFCSFLLASLLETIDGVIIQALCPQLVFQATQHFTDSMC